MGWMVWLGITLAIMKQLPAMMEQTEKLFADEEGSGKAKKEFVMGMVKIAAAALTDITGPEWDKVWVKVERAISSAIDLLCIFLFNTDKEEIKS